MRLFYVKFNENLKYLNHFENKLKLTCIQLLLTLYAMIKNPKSIIWDILVIFNIYMDIKGSFCREFEYLQYFLYKYLIFLYNYFSTAFFNCYNEEKQQYLFFFDRRKIRIIRKYSKK